jgi:hypothetical protein
MNRARKVRWVVVGLLLLFGCTVPKAPVDPTEPTGTVEILGPDPAFSPDRLPKDWVIEGRVDGRLGVARLDGVPALRIGAGAGPLLLVRRTRAVLLVSPYLSWAWNMEPQTLGFHPVALIVGFRGGRRQDGGGNRRDLVSPATTLPSHDRTLGLTWGDSALQRGSMRPEANLAFADIGPTTRYVVRGGRENARTWWLDTVDLSALYAGAWPDDDIGRVQIVFVAIAVTSRADVGAHIAGIRLSR